MWRSKAQTVSRFAYVQTCRLPYHVDSHDDAASLALCRLALLGPGEDIDQTAEVDDVRPGERSGGQNVG